jgi:thiamine-monophosphate kinase
MNAEHSQLVVLANHRGPATDDALMSLPERKLIERIRRMAGARTTAALVRGIGDDCAVLRPPRGHELLMTTDFSLEGVHFRREWHSAEAVGHRCLARGLSDIAAMGGVPLAAFLSLALPAGVPQLWVDGFLRGFTRLAKRFKTPLAGGDTAQSPGGVLADVVVLGSAPRGKAVGRGGARVGDDIYVTGSLGSGIAVLRKLQEHPPSRPARRHSAADRKHFFPMPRIEAGRWLREHQLASAMIDISDGLSTELSHLCRESRVGAWISQAALPIASGATPGDALHGGDEYELLFTAPAGKHDRIPDRIAGVPVHWLGTITKSAGMWLVAPDMKSRQELQPEGWQHLM